MTALLQTLRKRAQFLFVRDGARASRPSVSVEARRREPAGAIGVGYTASRKVGGAVSRNRAKRRLREAARRLLPGFGLPGVDYVLVARPATVEADWAGLLDDVQNALIRLATDVDSARPARRKPRASGQISQKPSPTESE